MERIAIYPGSFDPVTVGHVDIVRRAERLFDKVVVAVAQNSAKAALFTASERVRLLESALNGESKVVITHFDGLLVDFARRHGATAVVRGLRALSDFEYEFQMALMNRRLAEDIETVFLMTDADKSFISSSMVKEVARLGGNVRGLVPPEVEAPLLTRFGR